MGTNWIAVATIKNTKRNYFLLWSAWLCRQLLPADQRFDTRAVCTLLGLKGLTLCQWTSLNKLGHGWSWDRKWGCGEQKWRERGEIFAYTPEPHFSSLSHLTSPHGCSFGNGHIEHACQLHDVTCLVPLGMDHTEHTYQLHDVTCLVPVPVLGHRRSGSHGTTPIFVSTGLPPAPNPGMFGQSGLLPQILKLLLVSILYYRKCTNKTGLRTLHWYHRSSFTIIDFCWRVIICCSFACVQIQHFFMQ